MRTVHGVLIICFPSIGKARCKARRPTGLIPRSMARGTVALDPAGVNCPMSLDSAFSLWVFTSTEKGGAGGGKNGRR